MIEKYMILDRKYKEKVIRHELGHWFVAQKLGFSAGDITIKIIVSSQGGQYSHKASSHINLCPSLTSIEKIADYLIKRGSVLYAGTAFQSVVDKRNTQDILESNGADDNRQLTELCFIWRGITFPNDTESKHELKQRHMFAEKCWKKVGEIYDSNEVSIDAAVNYIDSIIRVPNKKYTIKKVDLLKLLIE
ncbi:TPA: hypothetical protein ACVOYP_004555 [Vibrio alginolyticus]|uniref:hypothetical protein n=1 Tax=Vibrio alginolyticus TaxID=663 RepID=UPI00215CBA0E|nr:hypothetical protein [Vibrio alginolyticus]EJV5744102.1 hypothetical protein [Vibrio alginolyticus]EKD1484752.1 hypothetical protein [Vibrio alginolyticus]MCR9453947.1 hypothetical protein [Vibrio alginolyticus]MCR9462511.1 hypothetical protein [Vibrio alginolyticus]